MQRRIPWWLAAVALLLPACGDDETPSDTQAPVAATCSPACDPCQTCDTSGATPVCIDNCGPGLTCNSGKCVAQAQAECTPACGACQSCDTSGAVPVCADHCGQGASCQNGECVAEALAECTPACGACQMCDTSGTDPVCVDYCAAGTECQNGQCVPPAAIECTPACGACQMCDTSGTDPVCVDYCASGTECQNGQCVPPAAIECTPACGACQMCDTSGADPVCVDYCANGAECQNGQCVPPAAIECTPACGACQMCDTSGTDPVCVDYCASGTSCQNGQCAPPADPCAGACASCQTCDTTHGVPACVDACKPGQACDTTANVCRPGTGGTTFDHSALPDLQGPFTADLAGGKAVTAKCLTCHAQAGQEMLKTAHFRWRGPTPNLSGYESHTDVGKANLVNNFCVATPSNETRCNECHAGYGWADNTFDFDDPGNVDCLVCHSPTYKKATAAAGAPASTVDMVAAAKTVGSPTRATCGRCHFFAGGGDNVKNGDLYSALTTPDAATDAHMGSANGAFQCADCHVASGHKIPGQGVHLPVNEGQLDCVDCHGPAPHTSALTNNHAEDIACQTCHIPAFSRQLPTKVDWNWSTAGNKQRGVNGIETGTLPDNTVVRIYDFMKGDFVWQKNVRPTYAWYDGRATRMTLLDSYPAGAGTQSERIHLGGPIATKADLVAKITPFKVMNGQQPVDTTTRRVLSPKLFGPGGFWATIPATYDATVVENNWTAALTTGARVSGQIGAAETFTGRATGAKPWDWAYTDMWIAINHEVAPKAQALGCGSCHSGNTGFDWVALGYMCDPMVGDPATCGSRHR